MSYEPDKDRQLLIFSAYNSQAQNNGTSATDVALDTSTNVNIRADGYTLDLPDDCLLIGDTRSYYTNDARGSAYLDFTASGLSVNMRSIEITGYAIGSFRPLGPQMLYGINRNGGASATKMRQTNTNSNIVFNEQINHSRVMGFIL